MQNGFLIGGGGSPIKSIQTGTVTASAPATISAVVLANSVVYMEGYTTTKKTASFYGPYQSKPKLVLTNTTTVTASIGNGNLDTIVFTVIEYQSGILKSNQTGTFTITGTTASNTATISAVTVANTRAAFLGYTTDLDCSTIPYDGDNSRSDCTRLILTNTTTLTANTDATGIDSNTRTISYAVLEYAS